MSAPGTPHDIGLLAVETFNNEGKQHQTDPYQTRTFANFFAARGA